VVSRLEVAAGRKCPPGTRQNRASDITRVALQQDLKIEQLFSELHVERIQHVGAIQGDQQNVFSGTLDLKVLKTRELHFFQAS
jgi:hypothetical protein